MEFETKLYKNYREKFFNVNIIVLSLIILLFFIGGYFRLNIFFSVLIGGLIIGGILYLFIKYIASIALEVEHNKEYIGKLLINKHYITWDLEVLFWSDLKSIQLSKDSIKGDLTNQTQELSNKNNPGINRINIKLKNGKVYSGYYLLKSRIHRNTLNKTMMESIKHNELSYSTIKGVADPYDYEEIKRFKQLNKK